MHRKWISMLAGAWLVGATSSCARTTMLSRTPPAPQHSAFRRILVLALLADADLRREMERRVAARAVSGRVAFLVGEDVFGTLRTISRDDSAAAIRALDIDATLYIVPGAAGADSGWTPPTTEQICAMSDPTTGCTFIPVVIGGSPYRRPWKAFTAALVDARTRAVVWLADATTNGSDYANDAILVRSMADRTVRQLSDDGLLR